MPKQQTEVSGEARSREALPTKSASIEVPVTANDVVALRVSIDFEIRPSENRTVGFLSTEGGTMGDKEAGRSYQPPED